MKKTILLVLLIICIGLMGYGKVRVVTSYKYIADIVLHVGGENVSVKALARGHTDPHFITPKPSFIAALRKADLLVINGGQLEIGWLPPVLKQANNSKVQPGKRGFLSFMDLVEPLDVPVNVSREHGDVHPEGNPHIHLDPVHIPVFARAVTEKLSSLDRNNADSYRQNYDRFLQKWNKKTDEWEGALKSLQGTRVVTYHRLYEYLLHRFKIQEVDTLEPLPGIPPSSAHIADIIATVKEEGVGLILQDVYHNSKTAKFVAKKTGVKMVVIPHDVGAVKEAADIFSLFDEIIRRLTTS